MNDLKRRTLAVMKRRLSGMVKRTSCILLDNTIYVTVVVPVDDNVWYNVAHATHDGKDEFSADAGWDIAFKRAVRELARDIMNEEPSGPFVIDCAAVASFELFYE